MTLDEALNALDGAVNTLEAANTLIADDLAYEENAVIEARNIAATGREALAVVRSFIEAVHVPAPTEPQGPPCGMGGGQ